jgi:hypothetical protein
VEAIASGFAWSSDRYQLRELVGSGGMSQVYRAWDRQLDREVAIKVLHPHLAASPDSRRRFSREARAVAKLHDPHILEIFDFSGDGEAAYIVTEFIRGTTLQKFSEQAGFGLPQIGALVAHSLCLALEHAHASGVVHRDLKPENVMLGTDGVLKLMDFGIARFLEQGEKMTMTGAMVGSPAYMAPEIIEGKDAGPKSDLFSLGTLLYWLLTGKLPFDAPNTPALLRKVVDVQYEDPRLLNGAISDSLAMVVRSLLARDPAARPESAEAVRIALAAALAEDGIADPEVNLRAFLADPAGFRHRFRAQLLTRLRGEADRALREGRRVTALKLADRILALEPADAEAHRLVAAVSAQQRRRRLFVRTLYACAGAAVATGAVAGLRVIDANRPTPPPPAVAMLAPPVTQPASAEPPRTEATPAEPPASVPSPATGSIAPSQPRFPTPAAGFPGRSIPASAGQIRLVPRPIGKAALAPVLVHFVFNPYATVTVDGDQRMSQPLPVVDLPITPGPHRLTYVANDAFQPISEDIQIGPKTEIRHLFQLKSARLRVISQPADASVIVDGNSVGSAADSVQHPILFKLGKAAHQNASVRVFKKGYTDWLQEVEFQANTETVLRPILQAQGGP